MINHVCTRLQNNDEYIELHAKNILDLADVRNQLKSQRDYWKRFSKQLIEDTVGFSYSFENLYDWIDKLDNFIKVNDHFPSIENSAVMLAMKNLNEYQVMPAYNKNSKELLEYWGYGSPNVIANQKGHEYVFNSRKKQKEIKAKPISLSEYKIVRIKLLDEQQKEVFLDIKVRNFDRKKFLYDVLTLPEFWRNLHLVSRKTKSDGFDTHPAAEINRMLSHFYCPSKKFSFGNNVITTNQKEVMENIKQNAPFDLYVNTFANHIFFRLPGLALPLTVNEQLWSAFEEPDMEILIKKNEFHLICVAYSDQMSENKEVMDEFSDFFSAREQDFSNSFDIGKYSGGKYLITTNNYFSYVYEANMIDLFHSITKLDEQIQ